MIASRSSDCLIGFSRYAAIPNSSAAGKIAGLIARGEHHDQRVAQARICLDLFGQGEAVHLRHVGVGQHQAIGWPSCWLAATARRASSASAAAVGLQRPVAEHFFEDPAIRGVVVDDQHLACRAAHGRLAGARQTARATAAAAADGEVEACCRGPSWLSTQIRPPIRSTSREEMANPRPVPP